MEDRKIVKGRKDNEEAREGEGRGGRKRRGEEGGRGKERKEAEEEEERRREERWRKEEKDWRRARGKGSRVEKMMKGGDENDEITLYTD